MSLVFALQTTTYQARLDLSNMKTMKRKELFEIYDLTCNEIVQKFANKQGLVDWYWIGKQIGGCVDFSGSYTFTLDEIVLDIRTNQPKGLIIQWQNEGLDFNRAKAEPKWINYKSYTMGLRYDLKL